MYHEDAHSCARVRSASHEANVPRALGRGKENGRARRPRGGGGPTERAMPGERALSDVLGEAIAMCTRRTFTFKSAAARENRVK